MNLTELLLWFAGCQAKKLNIHADKRGWDDMTANQCVRRLTQELTELRKALRKREPNIGAIINECADVANFAMFTANAARQGNLKLDERYR